MYNDGDSSAQDVTRNYVLERSGPAEGPALLSIFGGKITTFRRLAGDALKKLEDCSSDAGPEWTRGATLPGGDFATDDFDVLVDALAAGYPKLEGRLLRRLTRAYGTRTRKLLGDATDTASLGTHFGDTLYEREVTYLQTAEWANSVESVLWRRSKLGLKIGDKGKKALKAWFDKKKTEAMSPIS